MPLAFRNMALAMMGAVVMSSALAQAVPHGPAPSSSTVAPVLTRAQLVSVFTEPDGRYYARLKIPPKSKLPFATLTFRVADRSLLADISEGSWVKFTAKHVDGENTVTSIHAVAECPRFQTCG